MRTSENGGKDHIHEKIKNDESTKQEAREQLLYELRDQLGVITFETKENEDERERGEGVVIAKINGREADHYIYYEE
jgi:hypothetical protein